MTRPFRVCCWSLLAAITAASDDDSDVKRCSGCPGIAWSYSACRGGMTEQAVIVCMAQSAVVRRLGMLSFVVLVWRASDETARHSA